MRALAVENGTLRLVEDSPVPEPQNDEVLIRPILAGICNTDLELVRGYYDYSGILGHEFVGEVVQGPADWLGKRVVGEINIGCGTCVLCQQGIEAQCSNRVALGIHNRAGAFAEFFTLPTRNLYAVPETVTDAQAVFTEPLAAAAQVLTMAHIRPTDRVVVLGAGKLGMLVAQVLRLTGAALKVVVRHDRQAELLTQWGIQPVYFEALAANSCDVVVDCTGRAEGFADALALVRPRGTIMLKSTYKGLPQVDMSRIAVDEITVVGSRCGPFAAALQLLQGQATAVESLITATYPLEAGMAAFADAATPDSLKVLLLF
ncbi:alcohol dehydrogenase catalytic domain-containing protein [Chloroflexota bacterium]